MHSVPDTSGEALSRMRHAVSEGRSRAVGLQACEKAPDGQTYDFLRDLGEKLEQLQREIDAAHAAIDPEVVPMVSTTQGDPRLEMRVAGLMGKAWHVGELLGMEIARWALLAHMIGVDVTTLREHFPVPMPTLPIRINDEKHGAAI